MRGPYTFSVGAQTFRAAPMDADSQLQISRRVLPILTGLLPAMTEQFRARQAAVRKAEEAGEEAPPLADILSMDMSALVPGLQSAAMALANMDDEVFNYLKAACLRRVEMQRAGDSGWVPVWNVQAGRLQFETIEGHEVLLIVTEVLKREVGPFYLGLLTSLIDAGQ